MADITSVHFARLAGHDPEQASPDLLRATVKTFAEALMGAEADAVCGAGYGERSEERRSTRNGYRRREWDTRAGSIELAVPKLAISRVKSGLWAAGIADWAWRLAGYRGWCETGCGLGCVPAPAR